MQMLNQKKQNKIKIKKSQILLFGSLLIFFGIVFISHDHLIRLKDEVFNDMKIAMFNDSNGPVTNDVVDMSETDTMNITNDQVQQEVNYTNTINYEQYLGVLTIPKIGLKRGFFGLDSRYNDIKYNVTLIEGSNMPDVKYGNLMLMAHSGTAYISFFAYLYRLKLGDDVYVKYQNKDYHYKIVDIYNVEKTGKVEILRDYSKTSLTMITCTKDDDFHQTVYIAELI